MDLTALWLGLTTGISGTLLVLLVLAGVMKRGKK